MNRRSAIFILLLAGISIAGCAASAVTTAPQSQPAPATQADAPISIPASPAAHPDLPDVTDLTAYQFTVPESAISENPEFWTLTTEYTSDANLASRLDNNGIRTARANIADWPKFKALFDKVGAAYLRHDFLSVDSSQQEFAISGTLHGQTLFVYDSHGLSGSHFDDCQDFFALSYAPIKSSRGAVHLDFCPVVRNIQKQFTYSVLNDEQTIDYVAQHHLYDVGLQFDLAVGQFAVVAPSAQARRLTSIGHQFLTQDAAASRKETIFIFVANPSPTVSPGQLLRSQTAVQP